MLRRGGRRRLVRPRAAHRGRVGLVIGDVMGRGIAAAAVMGQLRAAVRACALVEDSPSVVLGLVDAAMSSLGQTSLTTCLYGVLDPATATLHLASAGHLPPLVVHRDGGGQYVEIDPGPPLGVGAAPAGDGRPPARGRAAPAVHRVATNALRRGGPGVDL